ncbi:MAG: RHS repeat domain-containing protein, partial [Chlamydiia bacterium]
IARIEGDQVQEVLCDLQGSVVWVEGEGTTTYDVFGVSSQPLCEWGYRAKWTLAEVGWVDFGRRIYAPELGIFVSPDPKGVQEGWWDHHYCDHAPLGCADPWGEDIMLGARVAYKTVKYAAEVAYRTRASPQFYMCFPEDCGTQWPDAMHRFMKKPGRKDIYFVATGINNTVEDHCCAVQGVAAPAMARGNAVVFGIYRPRIWGIEAVYACADAVGWQLPSPATAGVADGVENIIMQAQVAGDFGECLIWPFGHSAGAVTTNAVIDGLARRGVLSQTRAVGIAPACPIAKNRANGSLADVVHIFSEGDPVSQLGSALRDRAIAQGIDCGRVQWVSVPDGGDKHGFWASQHLEAMKEETDLRLDFHFDATAPVSSFIPRYEPSLGCLYLEHEKMTFEQEAERAVA